METAQMIPTTRELMIQVFSFVVLCLSCSSVLLMSGL